MSFPRFGPVQPAILLMGLLALGACASGPDPESTGPSHMYAHYAQVGEIQAAVVEGDVDGTRSAARWLSTHRGDEFPASVQENLDMMRNEARIILAQHNILEIGRSVARMGAQCGACHTALDGGPDITVGEPPTSSRNTEAAMARHAWASQRLWEGLIGPSDRAWAAGAGALASMPLDFGGNDQATRLAKRVQELSTTAREAKTPGDRAHVYGDILETCSLCHGALGMRMR